MAAPSKNDQVLTGWHRVGYARVIVALAMAFFALTERSGGAPHATWVDEAALALAVTVGVVGIIQASAFRSSLRAARLFAILGMGLGTLFLWAHAYDPSQAASPLLMLSVIELAVVFGRRGALFSMLALLSGYAGAAVLLGDGVQDPARLVLRVVLAMALAFGTAAIVRAMAHERKGFRESETLFRTTFDRAPGGIVLGDIDNTKIIRANDAFAQMLGTTIEALEGAPVGQLTDPEVWEQQQALQQEALAGETDGYELEKRYRRLDGSWLEAFSSISLVRDGAGDPAFWIAQTTDIGQRKALERALSETNEGLRSSVSALETRRYEAATLAELGGLLSSCAERDEAGDVLTRLLPRLFPSGGGAVYVIRHSETTLDALAIWGDMPADESSFAVDECWAMRRGRHHATESVETDITCAHVTPHVGVSYLCVPMIAQGERVGVLHLRAPRGVGRGSVHEAQMLHDTVAEYVGLALANFALRETLRAQSVRDPLTGLYNRRFLSEFLDRELRRSGREHHSLSVIMIDIDHLKTVNDTLGHQEGDRLICTSADLLTRGLRASDTVARYGGDEFIAILPDTLPGDAAGLCERIREAFNDEDLMRMGDVRPALSFGVAGSLSNGQDAATLIRAADAALYQAKRAGRDRVTLAPNAL